ncbi:MAG: 4-hydroxy-tetrahydrodipicolinate reductase [Ruminococcaceae bacterium]|nr:4-hydroxy-tetrahydrodipicolinate reductase [Oscillospiraceae bacterium]
MSVTKILFSGVCGRMGKATRAAVEGSGEYQIVAGVDVNPVPDTIPIFADIYDTNIEIDAIIDFSHHSATPRLLEWAKENNTPVVICTTGHTEEETALIHAAAEKIPVFFSRNMSIGINLMIELAKKAAEILGGYDIEIVEKHHNKKLDAPSGTALMIADAVAETVPFEAEYTYERQSKREQRRPTEIGISSVRGGTIVGEHEILFCGKDEIVSISHSAASRDVFAEGALRAAAYLVGKPAGFYNMSDMIAGK